MSADVVILCGGTAHYQRTVMECPVEDRRRRFVIAHPSSPYYGPTYMCCGCGDEWADGELLERPFARGWRQKAVARHRDLWRKAQRGTPDLAALYPEVFG